MKKNVIKRIIIIASMIMLATCLTSCLSIAKSVLERTGWENISPISDSQISTNDNSGYFFLTYEKGYLGSLFNPEAKFFITKWNDSKSEKSYLLRGDFANKNGSLLFKLPPGEYTICSYENSGVEKNLDGSNWRLARPHFFIKNGLVTYLGNIFVKKTPIIDIYTHETKDKISTDKELLVKNYPHAKSNGILKTENIESLDYIPLTRGF